MSGSSIIWAELRSAAMEVLADIRHWILMLVLVAACIFTYFTFGGVWGAAAFLISIVIVALYNWWYV